MRLRIRHETAYRYATPASRAIQTLRLTPRGHDGQFVVDWRIDDRPRLPARRDDRSRSATPSTPSPSRVRSTASSSPPRARSRRRTPAASSAARSSASRRSIFLRDTALTASDAAIRDFAETIAATGRRRPARHAPRPHGRHPRAPALRRRRHRHRHQRHRGVRPRPRRLPGLRPCLHRRRPPSRHSRPLCQRLPLSGADRPRRPGGRPRLGRGAGRRPRLGRLRPGQRHLPDRGLCPGRHRARLSRRRPVRGTRYGGSRRDTSPSTSLIAGAARRGR